MNDVVSQTLILALAAALIPIIVYANLAMRREQTEDVRLWHPIYSAWPKMTIGGKRVHGNLYRRWWNGKWEYREGENDPLDSQW